MTLILPPTVQSKLRPLAAASTEELLKELHARGLLHELSGTIAMPADILPMQRDMTIQAQAVELYKQMGAVIGTSGLSLLALTQGAVQEEIVAKVLICRHPGLPQTVQQAPAELLTQRALPPSGTSWISDVKSEPGPGFGTIDDVPVRDGKPKSSTKKAKS